MNGNSSKPYALLIFGVPMSGKTQFAAKFSRQFKAPLLNFNDLPDISYKTFLTLISQIAISKQTLIIEGAIDTQKQRAKLQSMLKKSGYNTILIWVQTDIATVKRRLKTVAKSVDEAKTFLDDRLRALEAPADSEKPIVISGKHTFETQQKTVLARISKL